MHDVMISRAEHEDRVARVRSVACPKCGAAPGESCRPPGGGWMAGHGAAHHGARWDAWYTAQAAQQANAALESLRAKLAAR